MVQRVVRQVREADLTDNITLATNASQLDIIINQLGGKRFRCDGAREKGHLPRYRSGCQLSETGKELPG